MIEINATGDTTLHTKGKYCEDDILVKVPAPKLQDKVITENGTYQADSGYDGLGSVTVEVAGSGGGNKSSLVTDYISLQVSADLSIDYTFEITD